MYKILIVEDDLTICKGIEKFLKSWNYEVFVVKNFNNILQEFNLVNPHIILLDITLPYFDGYYWCEEIRKISKVPIIFISSASDNLNIVMAMSMGGDDFITKPFDLTVLASKIQAMIRRTYDFNVQTNFIEYKQVKLNINDNTVCYKDNVVDLTKNEAKILKLLMENKNKIVEKDLLMEYLWKTDCYIDENTLYVNINRVRKKLETIQVFDFIKTKKGVGYII